MTENTWSFRANKNMFELPWHRKKKQVTIIGKGKKCSWWPTKSRNSRWSSMACRTWICSRWSDGWFQHDIFWMTKKNWMKHVKTMFHWHVLFIIQFGMTNKFWPRSYISTSLKTTSYRRLICVSKCWGLPWFSNMDGSPTLPISTFGDRFSKTPVLDDPLAVNLCFLLVVQKDRHALLQSNYDVIKAIGSAAVCRGPTFPFSASKDSKISEADVACGKLHLRSKTFPKRNGKQQISHILLVQKSWIVFSA